MPSFRATSITLLVMAANGVSQEAPHPTEVPNPVLSVAPGTRVPLAMINAVNTKTTKEGDRIYLESVFPVMVNGRVAISPGSHVAGTVTRVVWAGRVRGRSELHLRFDSLILPNGVTREFAGRIGALEGTVKERLDRSEASIQGTNRTSRDACIVGGGAAVGTYVGVIAGAGADENGILGGAMGKTTVLGAASGAAAGLLVVLLTRGPDAVLDKGTTVEMVLDRPLQFAESELLPVSPGARP